MTQPAPIVEMKRTEEAAPAPRPPEVNLLDSIPWFPCLLSLEIPIVKFTIGDLLALRPGSIVESACHHTSDVPLRVNGVLIGWTEFDAVGENLAVRITEQA
jgi:flagellar motor switch/type III secretory pathway protein FliN